MKLTAQAAAEWVFVGWTGDIESTEESVQIVIGESKTVTATFEKKKYPLTVNIEGEGEVLEEIVMQVERLTMIQVQLLNSQHNQKTNGYSQDGVEILEK